MLAAGAVSVPLIVRSLKEFVLEPLIVVVPLNTTVPELWLKVPLFTQSPPTVRSSPEETVSVVQALMLTLPVTVSGASCETVPVYPESKYNLAIVPANTESSIEASAVPVALKTTTLDAPGTAFLLQLEAVDQSPEDVAIQR
jgi:hypothetical protein